MSRSVLVTCQVAAVGGSERQSGLVALLRSPIRCPGANHPHRLHVRDAATCRCSKLFSFCCVHQSYSSPWSKQERTASLMHPESQRQLSAELAVWVPENMHGPGGWWDLATTRWPAAPLPLHPRQLRSNPSFDPFIGGPGTAIARSANKSSANLRHMSASNNPWSSLAFSVQHSQILSDDGYSKLVSVNLVRQI